MPVIEIKEEKENLYTENSLPHDDGIVGGSFLYARARIAEKSRLIPREDQMAGRREEKVTDNIPGDEATGYQVLTHKVLNSRIY